MNLQESIRQDLLKFEGFYSEVNESDFEDDASPSQEDQQLIQLLAEFRELFKKIQAQDTNNYILDDYKVQTLRTIYHDMITNQLTKRSGTRQGIPDLDGSHYDHAVD